MRGMKEKKREKIGNKKIEEENKRWIKKDKVQAGSQSEEPENFLSRKQYAKHYKYCRYSFFYSSN